MAVIVTKRYLYILALTILGLSSFYLVTRRLAADERLGHFVGPRSNLGVDQYLSDCGQQALASNPLHCMTEFPKKYLDKSFQWSGHVKSINQGYDLLFFKIDHFLTLDIKNEEFIVFLRPAKLPLVAELHPGDLVNFNATLASYGSAHGMYLHELAVVDGK